MEVLVCSFFKDLMSLHWFSLKPLISAMIVPVFEFSQFPYDYERWLQGSTHQKYHLWIHKRPVKWFHANEDQIRRLMYGVWFLLPFKGIGGFTWENTEWKSLVFSFLWPSLTFWICPCDVLEPEGWNNTSTSTKMGINWNFFSLLWQFILLVT